MRSWRGSGRRVANSLAALSIVLGAGAVGALAISGSAPVPAGSASPVSSSSPAPGSTGDGVSSSSNGATSNSQLLTFSPGQGGTGSGSSIRGIPTPTPGPGPNQTTTTVSLLGSPARDAVPVNGTVPYGEALTVVATVDEAPGDQPVTAGTVAFTENGGSVAPEGSTSAICQAVPVVQGTATCALSALAATPVPYQFGASYVPAAGGSVTPSSAPSAQDATVTVAQASTTITLTGAPDPTSPGNVRLTAVVADASPGSNLPPTGTAAFQLGGVAVTCEQAGAVLSEASSSSSTESCDVPAPSASTSYTAGYTPADRNDFAAAGPASASVAPGPVSNASAVAGGDPAPTATFASHTASELKADVITQADPACSDVFSTLWNDSGPLTFTSDVTVLGVSANITVTPDPAGPQSGTCSSTSSIAFDSATLSLFGGSLTGSDLSGTITDGPPQLCVTAGTVEGVTIAGTLCLSIDSASSTGGTFSGIASASLAASGGSVSIASVLTLSLNTITVSDAAPPSSCTLANSGDWYLYMDGTLSLALSEPSVSVSADANGCIDLTAAAAKSASVSFGLTSDLGDATIGAASLTDLTVTLSYASGAGFSAVGSGTLGIAMPSGGTLSATLSVGFQSPDTVIIGGEADLSSWLGSSWSGTAYVFYASAADPSYDTGISDIGTLDLVQGLNFAISLSSLPSSITDDLAAANITMNGTLLAFGSYDTSSGTFTLGISYTWATPVVLFNNQNVELDLVSAAVVFATSPGSVSINFALNATLYPDGGGPASATPDPSAPALTVTGTLTGVLSKTPSVSISVSLNESDGSCIDPTGGWDNAFGDDGLTVECAQITVGVTSVVPFVTGSIDGVITSLPSGMANAIGYQTGAPITFAFGFNPYYLDLSIGTPDSTTTALEPLAPYGSSYASDLQITYAQLCFALGSVTLNDGLGCDNGYVLAFSATIDSAIFANPVSFSVVSQMSISNPTSMSFSATISQITVGSDLNVGPVTLVECGSTAETCDNNTSFFQFEFDGSFTLSGSVSVPDVVQLSGSLSLSLDVSLSQSGFSAFASGSASGSINVWNPFANCSGTWYEPWTWSCSGDWTGSTGFSVTLGSTGISAGDSGLTVKIDGYSVTFPFDTNDPPSNPTPSTSVSLASSVNGSSSTTSTYGDPVTLTATVAATGATFDGGGSVSFYFQAGQPIPGCSGTTAVPLQDVSGSYTATCTTSTAVIPSSNDTMILPGGSDAIVAFYSGDASFPSAESSPVTETVNPASPSVTISQSPNPDYYGQSLSITADVSPADDLPPAHGGGTVTFSDNGTDIPGCVDLALTGDAGIGLGTDDTAQATCSVGSGWAAGTYPITASYSGDASANAASSDPTDVVVNRDTTSASVSESPTSVTYGNESYSVFTVTVTTTHGAELPETDPVTVNVGSASCTAQVAPAVGGGTGTCMIGNTDLDASSSAYTVTATYPGDSDLDASSKATASPGLTVIKDHTTTTISAPASTSYANETSVTFTVTVAPHYGETGPSGESVTIHVGSTNCVATLTNGTGTCKLAAPVLPVGGPYAMSAIYPGDRNFLTSTGTGSFSVVTTFTPNCKKLPANLAGANLAGCNLSGMNLKNADLEGVSLVGADLQGANLLGANLQGDDLINADLQGANVMGDNIQYVNLQGADLQGANLQNADVYETYNSTGANLEYANLLHANFEYANLQSSILAYANLDDANLEYANLHGANLQGAQFQGANLSGAIF